MSVCNFFLQGRCRYGDKCWNVHPSGGSRGGGGGGGGGYNNNYGGRSSGQQQQQQPRSGGFGNRVWVNPSQQKGSYIQPSSFSSQGSDDWGHGGGGGGGGGGRRENVKSSEFSFSNQNRFSALGTSSGFDRGARGGGGRATGETAGDEDDDKKLEIIQMDMDVWEKSRQWEFSCYCSFRTPISGFTDLSPEELRLEYYSTRASGDLQSYMNGVNQLFSQWKSRVQELKVMNQATRAALLAELNGTAPQASTGGFGFTSATGFGSFTSNFGSKGWEAAAPVQASGFGSAATQSSSTGFSSILAAPTQPPSGFSFASSSAPSVSEFSFTSTTMDKPAAASGFRFAPAIQPTSGTGSAGGASDSLFSPQSKLTEEELNQFKAKRFTLGQIPLKPPPADLLVV